MSKTRQPSASRQPSPRSPRRWQDNLRGGPPSRGGSNTSPGRMGNSIQERPNRRSPASTAMGGSLRLPSGDQLRSGTRSSSASYTNGTPSLSGAGATRPATAGKVRRSGASPPRRTQGSATFGRTTTSQANRDNGLGGAGGTIPLLSDVPLDSERLAQLAAASPISRNKLTHLLEEVKSEISRILSQQKDTHGRPPIVATIIEDVEDARMHIGGGTGETPQMAQTRVSAEFANGLSTTTAQTISQPISGSTGGGFGANHNDLMEVAAVTSSPHGSLVRRLCERVGNLQETLDAAWAIGVDSSLPPSIPEVLTTERVSANQGAMDSSVGLARLEDMLGRLEGQVAASFPIMKSAVTEGERRDNLCVDVGELVQQKMALEAEVRALLNQKQDFCTLSFPSGGRIATPSGPGVFRATSQPEELQSRSLHVSGRSGTAGVGSVSPVVMPQVMPVTVVASSALSSSMPVSSGYVRAARLSTPPRHQPASRSSSGAHNAEILQSRRARTLQAPMVSTTPASLHAALYVQR